MQKKTLMGSLPVYAQHLSEQTGVKVVVEGSQAYTDGTKVVVPFTESDPELSFGYVAHECSHVRNTDMQYFGEAQAVPFRLSVLNILEDIRIERLSMDQYPGTEGDLNHLVTVVLGDRLDPAEVAQKPALHVVHDTLLLAGRWQVLGQDLEQPATVMLQAQEKLLGAQLSARIMQKVGEVLQCDSTREVLALADAIIALLPSQEDPQDKGGSDQQEQPLRRNRKRAREVGKATSRISSSRTASRRRAMTLRRRRPTRTKAKARARAKKRGNPIPSRKTPLGIRPVTARTIGRTAAPVAARVVTLRSRLKATMLPVIRAASQAITPARRRTTCASRPCKPPRATCKG
ncbi:hypothetical protein ACE0DR_28380 [Azotobacter sp. CWF10]